ncbi:hypothetical protein ACO0LL_25635 [Undibacterium sp. TC4M20W]|uniref:hypothetical protein n=1 Tax=Undibacterium sp. TC4M20W TaxID=3413052 RepID=UPI003BF32E79
MKRVLLLLICTLLPLASWADTVLYEQSLPENIIQLIRAAFPETQQWRDARPIFERYRGEGKVAGNYTHALIVSFRDDQLLRHSALVVLQNTDKRAKDTDLNRNSDVSLLGRSKLWPDLFGARRGINSSSTYARIDNGSVFIDAIDFQDCCEQITYSYQFRKKGEKLMLAGMKAKQIRTDDKIERILQELAGCSINYLDNSQVRWSYNGKRRVEEKSAAFAHAFAQLPAPLPLHEFTLASKPDAWPKESAAQTCQGGE